MQIFSNKNRMLNTLKEKPFKLEKEIQSLFEENLDTIDNLKFVKSEFKIKDYRIDTLAYDTEVNAFVIIEYKRERNFSVIDQGVTYINLMLEHKAEFIVEYSESCDNNLKRNQVDWSQSRIIFVSTAFTDYQVQSTNFRDLAIELWEVKQFENNMISINRIKKSKSAPSIKQVKPEINSTLDKVTTETVVYDEEFHLVNKSDEIVELYERFKHAILALSNNLEIIPKKVTLNFRQDEVNIVSIAVTNISLKIVINAKKGILDDPKNLSRDISNIGHWGTGDYQLVVKNTNNLEYIMSLIKQVLY